MFIIRRDPAVLVGVSAVHGTDIHDNHPGNLSDWDLARDLQFWQNKWQTIRLTTGRSSVMAKCWQQIW